MSTLWAKKRIEMEKKNIPILIVAILLSYAGVVLFVSSVPRIEDSNPIQIAPEEQPIEEPIEQPLTIVKTIKEQGINTIDIIASREDITVKRSDDKNIKLTYNLEYNNTTNEELSLFTVATENNEKILKMDLPSFQDIVVNQVVLEIPKIMNLGLTIENLNGDVEIAEGEFTTIGIQETNGNTTIDNVVIKELNYVTSNGATTMNNITANNFHMDYGNSTAMLNNLTADSFYIDCGNSMAMLNNLTADSFYMDSGNAEATIEDMAVSDFHVEGLNGSIKFSNIETTSLIFDCINTEIEGNIIGMMDDYQLNLHTMNTNNTIMINNQDYGTLFNNGVNSNKVVDIGTYNADIHLIFEGI